ncbi:ABC transporter permease [uncultured Imperialibacter sp.]|uniref:ABC transporter permease n=1 Tax=uncultured Imperialibacter sp. TaxID=1672639 RepID=UPI0030D9F280|tara:strand:+ start:4209 stop:6818 length:2610 start_codon:yes stop_codon:yes gene_type:complete
MSNKPIEKSIPSPPKWLLTFLRWFCDPDLLEDVEGDLTELFERRAESSSTRARWLFALDVLKLLRPGIVKNFAFVTTQNNNAMLFNHIKMAIRHALRYKGYTVLNLFGLIVGLTSSILILLWVNDEVEKDQFHVNADRIYQVWRNMYQANGEVITTGSIPGPLGEALANNYPEVDEVTYYSWELELLFRLDENVSYEKGRYVSPEFFSIFSFPFAAGDPASALKDPHSVVISEKLAKKYFGESWKTDALSKVIKIDESQEFTVSGIFEDIDSQSSMTFDFVLPAHEYIARNEWIKSWFNGGFSIYFTVKPGADLAAVQQRIEQEINKNTDNAADERLMVLKATDTYLHSNFKNGVPSGGRVQYVRILTIIAIFLLVISCINFMNLATARASRRTKEIGVRKVLGAQRRTLGQQFMVESFMITIVAALLSIGCVLLIIPYFNGLTDKQLYLDFTDARFWMGIFALIAVTGLLSGSYPALLLPSFKVTNSLKGAVRQSASSIYFRNGLVVFQFALSIILIIGSLVVARQMNFVLNKNLGLDKENMAYLYMPQDLANRRDVYRTELLNIPEVKEVSFASGNPLQYGRSTGSSQWDGKDPNAEIEVNVLMVDLGFFSSMGMEIVDGRDFSKDFASDTTNYIINEVMADIMGFDEPLGQNLSIWGSKGKVIGIVKNFHMQSLYEPIAPVIVTYNPAYTSVALIRLQNDIPKAIAGIEKVTTALSPAFPFQYEFMDTSYAASYRTEMSLSALVNIFAIVSIFISCLGLFGLSSFSADLRSKEIGIRKVHGASVTGLIMLLSKDYTRLMIVAFVLAAPVAWYYMQEWLNSFAFRTDLTLTAFLLAGLTAFVVGALTVSVKSYQAASVNPTRTLKDE